MVVNDLQALNALKTIKEICEANGRCSSCPFRDNQQPQAQGCSIRNSDPAYWDLVSEVVPTRLFN